ncbi:MAG: SH3 domain-containing protein [Limisphaerales bacterium]
MKTIYWTILGAVLATSALAQDNTNQPAPLPAMPAPATSPTMEQTPAPLPLPAETNLPPVEKPKKKHVVHHRKISEPTVTLLPGMATVSASHVNIRGQAGLNGEAISHLAKGDTVTVLEQINLKKHASDEPAQWAKVAYPTNASIWVAAKYIDANNTVSTKKLNLRAGPGENFSVVGVLNSGDSVSPIETKGHWMKITPPTNSYAFIAAMYLTQTPEEVAQNTPPPAAEAQPMPAPTPTPVPAPQPIVAENNQPPAPEQAQSPVPPTPETIPQVTYDSSIPRVVSHEGVVRHVSSPITPTTYELYSLATDQNIDFLYAPTTNLDLGQYVGMQIIVTGQEDLAARWQIPVLTVQQIVVVNANAVPKQVYYSPRQQQLQQEHH